MTKAMTTQLAYKFKVTQLAVSSKSIQLLFCPDLSVLVEVRVAIFAMKI